MSKQCVLIVMLVVISTMAQSFKTENWAVSVEAEKETVTNLQFYFHDTLSGKNPSAIRVAQPADKYKSPTLFGVIMMADDPLTETPDPNSKLVGRAQGLYGSACQQELGLLMSMSFSFTDGAYNGSSISVLGKNSALNPVREMPIVGGTGLFRLHVATHSARLVGLTPPPAMLLLPTTSLCFINLFRYALPSSFYFSFTAIHHDSRLRS